MKTCPTFTHPTFDQFLLFHLGPYAFSDDREEGKWTVALIIEALKTKGFSLEHTALGADVHLLDEDIGNRIRLLCTKGEPASTAIAFLAGKMLKDRENNQNRRYGPLVIASMDNHEDFVAYYDYAVRDIFRSSVNRTLFADSATRKTSWYGRVNGYDQRRYLEEIINQLVCLRGFSTLVSNLQSQRGAMILTDAAHSASLAITLMGLINRHVSDQKIYTVAFACFVQHFGVLFSEQKFYPGKIYDPLDEDTLKVLAFLGISEDHENTLSAIEVDIQEVLRILRYNSKSANKYGDAPTDLYHYFSVANHFVALYFTKNLRVHKNGVYTFERNPSFESSIDTMNKLDEIFSSTPFYRLHRKKIYRFLENADHYYKSHIWSKQSDGAFVSELELRAFQAK